MMCTEAYKEWVAIFDDEVSEIWQRERRELQKTAMLLGALHKEISKVYTTLEVEVSNIRQQISRKDPLKQETKKTDFPPSGGRKKLRSTSKKEIQIGAKSDVITSMDKCKITEVESPDIFRNINLNVPESPPTIDLSISEDDDMTKIDVSPTLTKNKIYAKKYKAAMSTLRGESSETKKSENLNAVKKKLYETPKSDHDLSVIDCTPDTKCTRLKRDSKMSNFISKRKSRKTNRSTLTQMFSTMSKHKLNSAADKENDGTIDSDETFCEELKEKREMGITDLLNFINTDETKLNSSEEMDSTQEIDQFSKGGILDDSYFESPIEKPKDLELKPEPIVRGHARKLLNGFACKECKNFYEQMKLSPKALQKKMDECSKHRYKYRPPEDTLPGFWDITIPTQGLKEKE